MTTIALTGAGPGSPAAGYVFTNAEAAAYVAAMSVQPDNTRKAVIDQLFTDLKAGTLGGTNLLTVLDVLYLFAAHDSQAALLNAITPTNTPASPISSPTFTTDVGYTGNGTSSYVDMSYDPTTYPSVKMSQNSSSFGIWSNTSAQVGASCAGWFDGTDGFSILTRSATNTFGMRVNQAAQSQSGAGTVTNGSGFYSADRLGVSTTKMLRNGSAAVVMTVNANQTSTALNSASLLAGSITAASFSTVQMCAAFAGQSLGVNNVHLDFYNALRTYMTAVGVP